MNNRPLKCFIDLPNKTVNFKLSDMQGMVKVIAIGADKNLNLSTLSIELKIKSEGQEDINFTYPQQGIIASESEMFYIASYDYDFVPQTNYTIEINCSFNNESFSAVYSFAATEL